MLEFFFENEEGTGQGPTLEFYQIASEDFRRRDELLGKASQESIFPVHMSQKVRGTERRKMNSFFDALGTLVGRGMKDGRQSLSLPFNEVFWKLLREEQLIYEDLRALDPDFYNAVQLVQRFLELRETI